MKLRVMILVPLLGVLVSVLAVGVALAAQEESKDKSAGKGSTENGDDGGQAFELEGRPTTVNGYVDLGQQGLTPGDLYIFSDDLYRTANDQSDGQASSEKIGQADGRCTLIDPTSERLMCTVVSGFENGTIVTEGVMTDGEDTPSASSVTGGTGEYRGVTGEATLDLTPAEGPHAVRFDLQRTGAGSKPDREKTQGETKADDSKSQEKANSDPANKAGGKTGNQ